MLSSGPESLQQAMLDAAICAREVLGPFADPLQPSLRVQMFLLMASRELGAIALGVTTMTPDQANVLSLKIQNGFSDLYARELMKVGVRCSEILSNGEIVDYSQDN